MSDLTTSETISPEELAASVAQVWGEAPPTEPATPDAKAAVPAEGAKPADEEPKPASARIVAAKRAEARAALQRNELRAKEEALSSKERELSAREAEAKLLEEDPTRYFEIKKTGSAGIKAHLEKLAGTYAPEAVADRKLSAVEQELADLKKQIADDKQSAQQSTRAQQNAEYESQAIQAFADELTASIDQYPFIEEAFSPEEAARVGLAFLTEPVGRDSQNRIVTRIAAFEAANKRKPDHNEIAIEVNRIARAKLETKKATPWRKAGDSASGSQPTTPNGEPARAPTVKGTSPRTLSARDTSTRSSATSRELTDEERDAESIRILDAMLKRS